MLKHNRRFVLDMLIQENAVVGPAQQFHQSGLAIFDPVAAHVASIKLDEINC